MHDTVWKALPSLHKAWGNDATVVFNTVSGNTHLINSAAAKIISILQVNPCSALELAQQIAAETWVDVDEEIVRRVQIALSTLDELGLIEPLPS